MAKGNRPTEMAKLGQQLAGLGEKAGGWLDDVFGDSARHIGQALADSAAGYRVRNRIKVLRKTQEAIEAAGLNGATRPLGERFTLPLLEAIGEESDETLQDVWATYLRNALDPSKPIPDRILVDVIRKLEPSDWPLLLQLFVAKKGRLAASDFGLTEAEMEPSLDRLSAIGLLTYDDEHSAYIVFGPSPKITSIRLEISGGTYYEAKLLRSLAAATRVGEKPPQP